MTALNRPATWIMSYEVSAVVARFNNEFSFENDSNESVTVGVIDNQFAATTRTLIDMAAAQLKARGYTTRKIAGGTMLRVRKG